MASIRGLLPVVLFRNRLIVSGHTHIFGGSRCFIRAAGVTHGKLTTLIPSRGYTANNARTELVAAMQETKHIPKGPVPALVLGAVGLLPFIAAPWMCIKTGTFDYSWELCQVAYGASILSFLGGTRWGLAMSPIRVAGAAPDWNTLGYAMLPSLLAWGSLLMPTPVGLVTVAAGLVGTGYMDLKLAAFPGWYKGFRVVLTSVAVFSLLLTLLFHAILDEKRKEDPE